jgi:hypothetical protein
MPSPFRPTTIPLVSGAREDLADLSADDPRNLQAAENVLFTRTGGVRPRPGQLSHGTESVLSYPGITSGAIPAPPDDVTVAEAVDGFVPAGLVPVRSGAGQDTLLALYQGRALYRTQTGQWSDAGNYWSVRKRTSAGLAPFDTTTGSAVSRVSCGTDIVSAPVVHGIGRGLPVLDEAGNIITTEPSGYSTFLDSADPVYSSKGGVCCRTNHYWVDSSTNKLWVLPRGVNPGAGIAAELTGAGLLRPDTSLAAASDIIAACEGYTSSLDYVAFRDTDADLIHLLCLSTSSGILLGYVSVTAPANVTSVAVATDGDTVLLACATSGANGRVTSWTYTPTATSFSLIASSELTQQVTDDFGTAADTASTYVTAGFDGLGNGVLITSARESVSGQQCLVFLKRTLGGSPTGSTIYRVNGASDQSEWYPMFGPVLFGGRWVAGIQRAEGASTGTDGRTATWYVVEVPRSGASAVEYRDLAVIAASKLNGCARTLPSTATVILGDDPKDDILRFGVVEGRSYVSATTQTAIITAESVRIELALQGAAVGTGVGATLLSGCVPYTFDGVQVRPVGFLDVPRVLSAAAVAGASTLTAGADYAIQVLWRRVDRTGRITRSIASPIYTVTTGNPSPGVVTVKPTLPQLLSASEALEGSTVRVELYATDANPSAGAVKALVDSYTMDTASGSLAARSLTFNADDTGTLELYTDGDVIADERPSGGDRGIAAVGDRIWVAEARKLYASKMPSAGA